MPNYNRLWGLSVIWGSTSSPARRWMLSPPRLRRGIVKIRSHVPESVCRLFVHHQWSGWSHMVEFSHGQAGEAVPTI